MTLSRSKPVACCMVVSAMLCGCAIFAPKDVDVSPFGKSNSASQAADNVPIKHVVRLQTAAITSQPSDARLRNLIWEELDESGAMPPEDRIRLNQSGLRVGVSGGTLPWALNGLLPQSRTSPSREGVPGSFGTGIVILEGNQSLIESPSSNETIVIPAGQLAGLNKGGELSSVTCAFKVEPIEYAEGWAVFRVIPELRYGAMASRFSFGDDGGQLEQRQKVHPLYEQQFQVKLHVGESIVIGYNKNEDADWTVGQLLMQSERLMTVSENLIVLQLTDVEAVRGEKSLTFDYRRQGI